MAARTTEGSERPNEVVRFAVRENGDGIWWTLGTAAMDRNGQIGTGADTHPYLGIVAPKRWNIWYDVPNKVATKQWIVFGRLGVARGQVDDCMPGAAVSDGRVL